MTLFLVLLSTVLLTVFIICKSEEAYQEAVSERIEDFFDKHI